MSPAQAMCRVPVHGEVRMNASAEHDRLAQATGRAEDDLFAANPRYEWGPYLSERDHARSRAYRWNEDGMAGLSDIHHDLCQGLDMWNGVDPILKDRKLSRTVG